MKIDLAVIGQGAVTPAGVGLDALAAARTGAHIHRSRSASRISRGPSCAST